MRISSLTRSTTLCSALLFLACLAPVPTHGQSNYFSNNRGETPDGPDAGDSD